MDIRGRVRVVSCTERTRYPGGTRKSVSDWLNYLFNGWSDLKCMVNVCIRESGYWDRRDSSSKEDVTESMSSEGAWDNFEDSKSDK